MKAAPFRKLIEELGVLGAVRASCAPDCASEAEAVSIVRIYIQTLLDHRRYAVAALVLWGDRIFDPRPLFVRQVWTAIKNHAKLLFQGGGACTKTYSIIVWLLLDWVRDPQFTSIKIISTSAGHARSNAYATIAMLHREACIPLPGEVFSEHIGLESSDKRACISVVKIPQGDDGKGRLQGFHPIPRPKLHLTLGAMSRVRVFIDEAEENPVGVWEGVDNMLTTLNGIEDIKIFCAWNPRDQGSKIAQLAEPQDGWENVNENTTSWTTRHGWHLERLDAARCENVIERKVVYQGLQTYEGYRLLQTRRGGNTPEYWTFGRGMYPPSNSVNNVISPHVLGCARGVFTFSGPVMRFAGVDVAVEGRDEVVLTAGRFGRASGFKSDRGQLVEFPQERMVLQVDQQIELDKGTTGVVAHAIRDNCKSLEIPPANVMLDRTGNGATIHDLLCEDAVWSPFVMGVDFNKSATEMKILEQDKETAAETVQGVVTEVWWAMAHWMEFGYMAISPGVCRDRLNGELLGRKYKLVGKLYRVVPKDEFKSSLGYSPDYADSLSILLHAVRIKTQARGSMSGMPKRPRERPAPIHGIVDAPGFKQWADDGI